MNYTPLYATALACLIGAAVLLPLASAPAEAGSVTVKITPKTKIGTKMVEKGLTVVTKAQERHNAERIDQKGSGNSAEVSQSGDGNTLGVFQRGKGHTATASQDGNDNTLGIFQFGRNTSTTADQTGNGKTGLIIQGGW